MFKSIIILLESAASVVRRINADALYLPSEILLQRFQGEQIVAANEHVRRFGITVGFAGVFEQQARLKPRPVILPNPSEF